MGAFGSRFKIYRKRNTYAVAFAAYLDGRDSAAASWPDRDTGENDFTPSAIVTVPFGYRARGAAAASGNLGLAADVPKFTIAAIITREDDTGNDAIVSGALGSTHYARIYFEGTTLKAQVKLDGSVITLSVASSDLYITPGEPALIILRGDATTGTELLIDGTVRATDATTGTDYDAAGGDTTAMEDADQAYEFSGEMRFLFITVEYLTDAMVTALVSMLTFEGYYMPLCDGFDKWAGAGEITTANPQTLGNSPWYAVLNEA